MSLALRDSFSDAVSSDILSTVSLSRLVLRRELILSLPAKLLFWWVLGGLRVGLSVVVVSVLLRRSFIKSFTAAMLLRRDLGSLSTGEGISVRWSINNGEGVSSGRVREGESRIIFAVTETVSGRPRGV